LDALGKGNAGFRLQVVGCRLSVVGSEARTPQLLWEPTLSAISSSRIAAQDRG
jgi:hypothetical protein